MPNRGCCAVDLQALASYDYALPHDRIAQYPCTPRDHSRLLLVDRTTGNMDEIRFSELTELLQAGDQLIFNDTKVIPARLIGQKKTGGTAEVFLIEKVSDNCWEALVRPGKRLKLGSHIQFGPDFSCEVIEELNHGKRIVRFFYEGDFDAFLQTYGQIPLPHYIGRTVDRAVDPERYQTVYAQNAGAIAAPTAGLHFTDEMLSVLKQKKVLQTYVTLHVGVGTFRPVVAEDITQHQMHDERAFLSDSAAEDLNRTVQGRQICVGTTTCRALESVMKLKGRIESGGFETNLFITPGFSFRYTKALLTNFHLPRSSLLMLVCAFGGYDLIMEAYAKAIKDGFRFYSYGDAMLIY